MLRYVRSDAGLPTEPDDRTRLVALAPKPPREKLRQGCILNRADHLSTSAANGRENFRQVEGPIVVDMLDRIVED